VAIEPLIPVTQDLNLLANRYPRLTVLQAAASDSAGEARLRVPIEVGVDMGGYATLRPLESPHEVYLVPTIRLDDLGLTNVSALKIDVEGHERFVIAGAVRLIRDNRPLIMIEVDHRYLSVPVTDVLDLVEHLGYKAFFLESGTLHEVTYFSVAHHQRPDRSPYISNFIFMPR
jgi:FkbM family methyltransferase